MEGLFTLQSWTKRTDDRYFEAVKNPGDAEANHDEQMKSAPGKPIEPKGDVSSDFRIAIVHAKTDQLIEAVDTINA